MAEPCGTTSHKKTHLLLKVCLISSSILIFLSFILKAGENFPDDIIVLGKDTSYHLNNNNIKKGERIFYGLLDTKENTQTCISCHNIKVLDTLNWNPSAFDIATTYYEKNTEDLKNVLLNPTGKKMTEVHKNYDFDEHQIVLLKGYLHEFYDMGGIKHKPVINKLLIFIGLVILLMLTLVDLWITKKIKFRIIHLAVILGTLFLITRTIVIESIALGRQKNYMPMQPIKFSHHVHAGINGTDCLYCHNSAEYGKSAGIPSLNVCWNCHAIVREGTNSGKFEINKIVIAHEQTKQPIRWIRIHNLPDHVFFSHAQHVGAGKLECEECHGPVDQIDVMYEYNDLSMGWCLNCHRTKRVQFTENKYYDIFKEYHDLIIN